MSRPQRTDGTAHARTTWLRIAGALVGLIVLAGLAAYLLERTGSGPAASLATSDDARHLRGRWVRLDGDYVLDIQTLEPDGKLEARYLNPRPIRVAEARARLEGGQVQVFVELRDEGYPGSTYRLSYDPQLDRLAGIYHQLPSGQEFQVVFVRLPAE